jgi:hypothetical protein
MYSSFGLTVFKKKGQGFENFVLIESGVIDSLESSVNYAGNVSSS